MKDKAKEMNSREARLSEILSHIMAIEISIKQSKVTGHDALGMFRVQSQRLIAVITEAKEQAATPVCPVCNEKPPAEPSILCSECITLEKERQKAMEEKGKE